MHTKRGGGLERREWITSHRFPRRAVVSSQGPGVEITDGVEPATGVEMTLVMAQRVAVASAVTCRGVGQTAELRPGRAIPPDHGLNIQPVVIGLLFCGRMILAVKPTTVWQDRS